MIMSKESYEAWSKMQHYVYELNLNIEHQLGWKNVWDDSINLLSVFDEVLDELMECDL